MCQRINHKPLYKSAIKAQLASKIAYLALITIKLEFKL